MWGGYWRFNTFLKKTVKNNLAFYKANLPKGRIKQLWKWKPEITRSVLLVQAHVIYVLDASYTTCCLIRRMCIASSNICHSRLFPVHVKPHANRLVDVLRVQAVTFRTCFRTTWPMPSTPSLWLARLAPEFTRCQRTLPKWSPRWWWPFSLASWPWIMFQIWTRKHRRYVLVLRENHFTQTDHLRDVLLVLNLFQYYCDLMGISWFKQQVARAFHTMVYKMYTFI